MPTVVTPSAVTPERVIKIDEINGNLSYIGIAKLGTADADAKWQIRKIEKPGGTVTSIQYANGSRRFNQVWDDRASLSYSN